MNDTNPSTFDLEKSLEQLESIVSDMEKDTSSIETSLAKFETGIKIIRDCQRSLEAAEQKIKVLTEQNGSSVLVDYPADIEENH